jgi:hypothetical protein
MSQDASPGIAKGLTTLRENSQSAQDWRPGTILSRPFGTQFVNRVLTQALKAVPFKKLSLSATCEAVPFLGLRSDAGARGPTFPFWSGRRSSIVGVVIQAVTREN